MARATTHPISDQPKKILMTMIEPRFGTFRITPTMVGMKQKAIPMRMSKTTATAAPPPVSF